MDDSTAQQNIRRSSRTSYAETRNELSYSNDEIGKNIDVDNNIDTCSSINNQNEFLARLQRIEERVFKTKVKEVIVEQQRLNENESSNHFYKNLPKRRNILDLDLKAEDSLMMKLKYLPFPKNPTYIKYIRWKRDVRTIIQSSYVIDTSILYECLRECFYYSPARDICARIYNYTPYEDRIAKLLNELDELYANPVQRTRHIQRIIAKFIPKGNGPQIYERYISLLPPDLNESTKNFFLYHLHNKLPENIRLKIESFTNNKITNDFEKYAKLLRAAIPYPINTNDQKIYTKPKVNRF